MEKRGIDISYYQGDVDFEVLKEQVDFVILRCGYGGNLTFQDDKNFTKYADACTRYHIPFGVYLYSYAINQEQAMSEVEHTLRLIEPYDLEYPVYLDVESQVQSNLSKQALTDVVVTYCEGIEKAGYYVGIYASLYWFQTKLDLDRLEPYDKWLAQWNSVPTFQKPFGIWQYDSKGKVSGIQGNVDRNIAYIDYPTLIKEKGLNRLKNSSPSEIPLKYHVQDKVICNGYLYRDSYGNGRGQKKTNFKATITSVNPHSQATKPYNINHGLGWMSEADLTLSSTALTKGDQVQIVLPGKSASDGSGSSAMGIGWKRQILAVIPGALYPYRVGNASGTTGYYQKNALRKL